MGIENPRKNDETRPTQEQQANSDGENNRVSLTTDMNSSETQFGQDHPDRHNYLPELCGQESQHLSNLMEIPALISTPERQLEQPDATDATSQDQMQWAHDRTHFKQQDTVIRNLEDEVLQPRTQLKEYRKENTKLIIYNANVKERAKTAERRQINKQKIHQRRILKLRARNGNLENTELKSFIADIQERAETAERRRAAKQRLHQRDVENLQTGIVKLESEIRELKTQVVSYKAEKSKNKAIANSRKISDDAIKASWRTMAYNIQGLVATILTGCPSEHDLNHHGHEGNEKSCAVCQISATQFKLLQDDDMRPFVVEKFVWDAVTRRILGHDTFGLCKSWARAPGMMLSTLLNNLIYMPEMRGNTSKLLRWKAEGAAMIYKAFGIDDEELDNAVHEEFTGLRRFIPRDCPDSKTARQNLCQDLRKIFEEAIEIHRILMQSRAHFYLDQVKTPATSRNFIYFNPGFHEPEVWDAEPSEKSIVLLGISPSLVKVGNADGGNYDTSNRLIKASVICN
ncbi:hypothetical protein CI238_11725 [Colletotrichum incanum]|uniref:Uncharacterized protein n=1 Tax=Colletotrichum incanum TaxID=1573173 RepID=A0A161VYX1_COLIC|nr:hypothetical protein CI238_11725 [Colletotrichum incanum]